MSGDLVTAPRFRKSRLTAMAETGMNEPEPSARGSSLKKPGFLASATAQAISERKSHGIIGSEGIHELTTPRDPTAWRRCALTESRYPEERNRVIGAATGIKRGEDAIDRGHGIGFLRSGERGGTAAHHGKRYHRSSVGVVAARLQ